MGDEVKALAQGEEEKSVERQNDTKRRAQNKLMMKQVRNDLRNTAGGTLCCRKKI